MTRFVISGTDTGIGKTIFSAALTQALGATYWKPVQSGLEEIDSDAVRALTGAPILPEAYRLTEPLSPHRSAELDGVRIDPARLALPDIDGPFVIEGAGGLLVPLTRDRLYVDQMAEWDLPVILCARTGLGTINHSLLSIEALVRRGIVLHGLVFIGEDNPDNIETICEISGARSLGRLPHIAALTGEALGTAFHNHFDRSDFL